MRETDEHALGAREHTRGATDARSSARSRTARRPRWVARAAMGYFALSTVALVAPAYTAFGNAIEPRVLGLPWSLAYVLGVVLLNATVLAMLYAGRWVDGDDGPDPPEPREQGSRP